jgi:ParB family transcriptional regulator, chromosome partitioning protein
VREATEGASYWAPNGYHRLTALKELGAKSVLALVVPERAVAYQILALNIEKAHNLRERAIGVRRMYEDLVAKRPIASGEDEPGSSEPIAGGSGRSQGPESSEEGYALEFEEPALATLGFAYEARGRISGGAYHAVLRRADRWLPGRLADALPVRRARAALLLDYDDAVTAAVAALKARGFSSPYLRNFVVARTNPLRFIKGEPPPLEELLPSMAKRARGIDAAKIKSEDLARAGGAPEASE